METKPAKLASKLVTAMKAIGVVEKRGKNTKQDYKFVKAADVANEVRQALSDAGVAFTFDIEEERTWEKQTNSGGTLFYCGVKIRGDFHDAETGETLSGRSIGWGADSLDKAPYKAMTGALKYLLRMNFLIPDEEDPEVDNAHYDKDHAPTNAPAKPVKKVEAPKSSNTTIRGFVNGDVKQTDDGLWFKVDKELVFLPNDIDRKGLSLNDECELFVERNKTRTKGTPYCRVESVVSVIPSVEHTA